MTREEAISRLNKFAENAYGPWHDGDADIEAIDMAIEALDERKVELFDDGTLVVNVKEGEKVGRVLICGDDHFGGLYYIDAEPVVRCKECMYFKEWTLDFMGDTVEVHSCSYNRYGTNRDDYCSRGKRRKP